MLKFFFTAAALSVVGLFCGSCQSDQEVIQKAENEVFAIHDEVMPKIDDVLKLRKQLKQRIATFDSLKTIGSPTTTLRTEEEREQARRLNQKLTVADSLMMGWMSHYNGDTLAKLPLADALRYLADQKDEITDVKTKLNTSLEQARQFLGNK